MELGQAAGNVGEVPSSPQPSQLGGRAGETTKVEESGEPCLPLPGTGMFSCFILLLVSLRPLTLLLVYL
jgi:hypothetical protein